MSRFALVAVVFCFLLVDHEIAATSNILHVADGPFLHAKDTFPALVSFCTGSFSIS
jgi:hypothetical protein